MCGNFIWTTAADQDDLLKVLKAFEDYFQPAQNKYHCWYSLGGIYSSQFKSQSEFMVRLRECVRECSFEKPDEVVKFLFLTHNQNAHVRDELLKSMKDADGLNDILGYACLVEGTQHSESLSKAYFDTVKILNSSVKVDAIVQKKNKHNSKFHSKHNGSKHRSQSKGGGNCCNCGTSHPPKRCPAYGKVCYNYNKKGHFKPLCRSRQHSQSCSRRKGSQSRSRKDQHEVSQRDQTDDSSWYTYKQDSIQIVYNKGIRGNISNICFDEIDGQNCSSMLADLTLCKAQGPKDCHMTNFENFQGIRHRFKLDSGACRNLLPLRLYKELFPHVTRQKMLRSIDHRVQLLAYNKKEIHQYGVCYLHVKCKNCVKLCKFYVVDSKFNPIIGVNSACHLGLLKLTEPVFENWTDTTPIKSSELNIDTIRKTTRKLSPDQSLSCDKVSKVTKLSNVSNISDIPETLTRERIINYEKYKHLFQGIGHFKCNPVSIEMQEGSTPVRKPARKVPLALREKFKQVIDSMVKAGILTEVTPEMSTPEWLNSFVIVKKPNGNLRVCLDPTDLNKHIICPTCNMRTLEETIDMLKGSMYFAVFDSTKSFFHVPLDRESKQLTAMLTPIGIYLYNVLAMDLSNATDIFEKCMRNIVDGLQGVVNITDDVLVFATKYERFKENVINFLDRCVEHDLHLNTEKIRINVDSTIFWTNTDERWSPNGC